VNPVAQTRELGGCLCGRRLYGTMLVWETDASLYERYRRAREESYRHRPPVTG
jgi:hypothetical protein